MLSLKSLSLTNFGTIRNKTVEFQSGVNLLLAKNGSGKTFTYKAIEMLLADSYEGSYEDYINWDSDFFKLELNFYLDNESFIIALSCNKSKKVTTERILMDGNSNILAEGEEAKNYLSDKLDKVLVRYALVVKQGQRDHIVASKDNERLELYKKIEDIDYKKEVKEDIEPRIQIIKDEIAQIDKELYSLEHKSYNEKEIKVFPFSQEVYTSFKNKLIVLTSDLESYNSKVNLFNEKTKNKELLVNELDKLNQSVELKDSKLEELTSQIYYLNSKAYDKKSLEIIQEKEKEILSFKEYENTSTQELNTLEKEKIEKEKSHLVEKEKLEEQIKNIETIKYPKYDDTDLKDKEKEITSVEINIKNFKAKEQQLASGVCPTCSQDCVHQLPELGHSVLIEERLLSSLKEQLKVFEEEKKSHEDKIEENQKNKEKKDELKNKLENLITSFTMSLSSIESKKLMNTGLFSVNKTAYENKLKIFDEKLTSLKSSIQTDLERALLQQKEVETDKSNLLISINEKEKLVEELYNWLNLNPVSENNINTTEIDTLTKNINSYDEITNFNKVAIEHNKELLIQKEKDSLVLKDKQKEKELKLQEHLDYEVAKNILLKDFPNYVIDSNIQDTENQMNQFIDDVYWKSLNVELRPTATTIKLEYGTGGRKAPGFQLSGAEAKIVDIAFKTYYNRLAELDCILLDEPDAPCDKDTRLDMYGVLANMGSSFAQMGIVTHSREMVDFLKNSGEVNVIEL